MLPGRLRRRAPRARLRLHRARRPGPTVDSCHAVVTPWTSAGRALRRADPRPRRQHRPRRHLSHRRRPGPGQRAPRSCTATPSPCSPGCSTTADDHARSALAIADRGRAEAEQRPSHARPSCSPTPPQLADRPTAPPAGSTSSPTTGALTAEQRAADRRRGRRRHAARGCCAASSSPATTPRQVLADAIAATALDDRATDITNVLHSRITDGGPPPRPRRRHATPTGSRASTSPNGTLPRRARRGGRRARAPSSARDAAERAAAVGRRGARRPPPDDAAASATAWERRAGVVAALPRAARPRRPSRRARRGAEGRAGRGVRRLPRGLARARPPGGRPRRARDVRRPAAHAGPRLASARRRGRRATSANELAGTRQAAEHHRQTAALRTRRSRRRATATERARLEREAAEAAALAEALDAARRRAAGQLDDARARGSPTPP